MHNYTNKLRGYCELEDGLWVNIAILDSSMAIHTHSWGFYKHNTAIKLTFNKTDQILINFTFNMAWFDTNIPVDNFGNRHQFKQFFESGEDYKTWGNIVPGTDILINKILAILSNDEELGKGIIKLKLLCLRVISSFFTSMTDLPTSKLHAQDSLLVTRVEKALMDNLLVGFPGVLSLATSLYTSSTKIQLLFKAVHGKSMYQYYQEKQMGLALQLLKTSYRSTKDIALTFGYKNSSKFSAAFKKHHHVLPSEVSSLATELY